MDLSAMSLTKASDPNCIFCKIIGGQVKSEELHRDEDLVVIRDISPQAPVHLLILPLEHIARLSDAGEGHEQLLGRMLFLANRMAVQEGVAAKGYRIAVNTGTEGGQTVGHLHMHLLGGRQLSGQLG